MRTIGIGIFVAITLTACHVHFGDVWDSSFAEETEEFDVPAGELTAVDASTHNGAIVVEAADPKSTAVHVRAVKRATGCDDEDARAALAALEVTRETEGGTLTLRHQWRGIGHANWGSSVSYTLTLPAALGVRLESHNGSIESSGMTGDCRVVTHNGKVRIRGGSPAVSAETHNGTIQYEGAAASVELSSSNGSIQARLDAPSVGGTIRTSNGAITLELDPAVSSHVIGSTGNGEISLSLPTTRCTVSRRHVELDLHSGGPALHVSTSNGSLSIR